MSEAIRIDIFDQSLKAVMALMDEALRKKELLLTGTMVEPTKIAEAGRDLDKILTQAGGLDAILFDIDMTKAGLEEVDAQAGGLLGGMGLPTIDRGTRMILLRIPGLREAMRLLYMIKMMQTTLGLGEIRGPVTAAILSLMYAYMALDALNKRQDRLEAKISDFERTFTRRFITMEEAVRGHGVLAQRYRSTVNM